MSKVKSHKNQDTNTLTYPGFHYPADQVTKYIAASDLFTLLLKNGDIVHFTARDKDDFHQWLAGHQVVNIKF